MGGTGQPGLMSASYYLFDERRRECCQTTSRAQPESMSFFLPPLPCCWLPNAAALICALQVLQHISLNSADTSSRYKKDHVQQSWELPCPFKSLLLACVSGSLSGTGLTLTGVEDRKLWVTRTTLHAWKGPELLSSVQGM